MKQVAVLCKFLLIVTLLILTGTGCSVVCALNQPPFIDFNQFTLGESRVRVTELAGVPKTSTQQPMDGSVLEYHEFTSGTPGETRLRAIGYLAGDVITLGLTEIIFWPIELTVAKPRDFKGFFAYNTNGTVTGYRIVYGDGSLAKQDGNMPN